MWTVDSPGLGGGGGGEGGEKDGEVQELTGRDGDGV